MTPEQLALLRGAVAVPKNASLAMASAGSEAASANRLPLVRACHVFENMLAATPPAYAEALSAVLDGYEAMQRDAARYRCAKERLWLNSVEQAEYSEPGEGWIVEQVSDAEIDAALAKLGETA